MYITYCRLYTIHIMRGVQSDGRGPAFSFCPYSSHSSRHSSRYLPMTPHSETSRSCSRHEYAIDEWEGGALACRVAFQLLLPLYQAEALNS